MAATEKYISDGLPDAIDAFVRGVEFNPYATAGAAAVAAEVSGGTRPIYVCEEGDYVDHYGYSVFGNANAADNRQNVMGQ